MASPLVLSEHSPSGLNETMKPKIPDDWSRLTRLKRGPGNQVVVGDGRAGDTEGEMIDWERVEHCEPKSA